MGRNADITVVLPRMRPPQQQLFAEMQRHNVWVCHRRMGKTFLALQILLAKACANPLQSPRYAYLSPLYRQAKQVAWDWLQRFTAPIPGTLVNQAELRVDLPTGARIQLLGAEQPNTLRGVYLDGVVLDEYAQMAPSAWSEVLRPALSDRQGWAIFIGTPMGRNHFYDLYQMAGSAESWGRALFAVQDTQLIPESELANARLTMSEAEYRQEFECSWDSPMPGAVYKAEMTVIEREHRITAVPYLPEYPVSTAWDIGPAHTAIWWFQQVLDAVHVIDYAEGAGSLEHWVRLVQNKPYIYDHAKLGLTHTKLEMHYGPHDLEQQDYATGKTRYGAALEMGLQFRVLPRGRIEDGIETGRRLLRAARFHADTCEAGINALRSYRYDWNDQAQTYRVTPRHDWASHGADAWRYAAVGVLPARVAPVAPGLDNSFEAARRRALRARKGLPVGTFRIREPVG